LAKVHGDDVGKLPKEFTWKGRLNAMKDVQDQGACGSCWAVAASTVLRAHAELYQKDRTFSAQQIVTCAPNPQHCGGTGGCEGATAELAMDYVAKVGLVTEEEMSYEAVDGSCPTLMRVEVAAKELQSKSSSPQQKPMALPDVTVAGGGGEKFGMTGWKKLPENKVEPLMLALYEQGPVAISIAAGDDWSMYDTGIMSACSKATVINHAVVLTGYGERGATSIGRSRIHGVPLGARKASSAFSGTARSRRTSIVAGTTARRRARPARAAPPKSGSAAAAASCTTRSCPSSRSARAVGGQSTEGAT